MKDLAISLTIFSLIVLAAVSALSLITSLGGCEEKLYRQRVEEMKVREAICTEACAESQAYSECFIGCMSR
jgi:hypothetical protein